MGMGAHHQRGAAIAPMADCHLFAGRLAMDIHDDSLRQPTQGVGAQHGINGGKRVVERAFHEHLPQHLRDQHLAPAHCIEPRALARGHLGIVQRAQDARLLVDETQHVFLVKGMVAQRDAIGPGGQQQLGMVRRQPRPRAGVFAIDHHEIKAPVGAQLGQPLCHRSAPGPPHHIAKEQNFHGLVLGGRWRKGKGNWVDLPGQVDGGSGCLACVNSAKACPMSPPRQTPRSAPAVPAR